MAPPKFKVLIAGGSVAGLTLANMLDQVGIDYLVLEAYSEIAPQVGASIGLQASGLRILDQLGCVDALLSLIDKPLYNSWVRDTDGSALSHFRNSWRCLTERHGYQTIFIDRQMLIQVLYDNLASKDRVLTSQKVKSVETFDTHVEVTTESGDIHMGDVLVGADGVYSTVRGEMWRLAQKATPGHFPANEWSAVPCHYQCIFGISSPIKQITDEPGVHYTLNDKRSYLVMTGPEGRVYWFLFKKLPTTKYGNDIPKYSKKDEEELAALHASDPITPTITFGEIYAARTSSVLTPLHEHAFSKWYYQRIITIGDSSHKFNPITGHGGNSAIESAATLVNHLLKKLGNKKVLTTLEIEGVFKQTQDDRFDRVSKLVKAAHRRQQNDALETPFMAAIARYLPPLLSQELGLQRVGASFVGATRLEMMPRPTRPHIIPYDDELPAKPQTTLLPAVLGLASQIGLYWVSRRALKLWSIPQQFIDSPILKTYTGVPKIDGILARLVTVFGWLVDPANPAPRLHMISFIPIMCVSALDWTIEGNRSGNKGTLISWPSIWSALYQIYGIGKMAPLYNIASILTSVTTMSLSTVGGRAVSPEVSEALLPSLAAGIVIPSIFLFTPLQDRNTWQKFVAFWQPSPAYVGLLTTGLSKLFLRSKTKGAAESSQEKKEIRSQPKKSLKNLKRAYAVTFGATALCHLYTMYHIWKSPDLSVGLVFGQLISPFSQTKLPTGEGITAFLKWDLALCTTSFLANSIYRIWELRRLGFITTNKALKATVCTSLGHFVVGPAASHIGLAGWKENELAKFDH